MIKQYNIMSKDNRGVYICYLVFFSAIKLKIQKLYFVLVLPSIKARKAHVGFNEVN